MENKRIYEMQAEVSKALAHPLRMEIIHILKEKEACFADILKTTGGLKSNLSQHLKIMTAKGILNSRRDGQCSYFSLSSPKVAHACQVMREVLMENLQEKQEILNRSGASTA